MLEIKYVYSSLEFWGSIFLALAAVYLFIGKAAIKEQYRALAELELTVGIMLLADAVAWFFDGTPGELAHMVLIISNFVSFALNALLPVYAVAYVVLSIDEKVRNYKMMYYIGCYAVLTEVFLAVAQMSNFVFVIDRKTNLYQRRPGFTIWTVVTLLEAVMALLFVIKKRDFLNKYKARVLICFIVFPILASFVQVFIYGFSLSNLAFIIVSMALFGQALQENARALLEQKAQMEEQNEKMEDMRIRIALSQIKPHFLYNTLNSIYVLCDEDAEQAKGMIKNLADYLRGSLETVELEEPIPFTKELDHTKIYLDIEKARFRDRFFVEYDIRCTDFEIPALTLQPIVENAVKHGISKRKSVEPALIEIKTEDGNGFVKITVSDNGVGFNVDKYNMQRKNNEHIGLRNVGDRLKIMKNAEMHISSYVGRGTTVEIIVPRR